MEVTVALRLAMATSTTGCGAPSGGWHGSGASEPSSPSRPLLPFGLGIERSVATARTSLRRRFAWCCFAMRARTCSAAGVAGEASDELLAPGRTCERCARCRASQRRNQSLCRASAAEMRSRGSGCSRACRSSRASAGRPSSRGCRLPPAAVAGSAGGWPVSSRCRTQPADQTSPASRMRCTSRTCRVMASSCEAQCRCGEWGSRDAESSSGHVATASWA
mmetsp:Transcript_104734/g.337697  ORF Transcript_104734/g.337697 Transcript_104734/m.337697 type:complete len:220 (-) Transcript_104734:864-1523(-)